MRIYIIYIYIYIYLNYISRIAYQTIIQNPDASDDHASGAGQVQANPPVAVQWLSPGKSTGRVVTTMRFNDMVAGEENLVGTSCGGILLWKIFQETTRKKIRSRAPEGGLM